ncbi:TonB-dependent receptor [Salinispirillum sp. LH 10-3-1]|uniref:TonB-dependent receptor n=1 Tax=Salinispirillum sp. LH 10-3-1 TaxID=2952525 RepID=A0AB38YDM7_9GAMM
MNTKWLAVPLLGAITLSASAELMLSPVTVTASRFQQPWENTPSGVTVLSGETLRAQGYTTVEAALASLPELNPSSTGGDQQFGLRGLAPGSSDVLILLDGQKLNQNDISAVHLSGLSLQNVERIEIIRRSSGVLYGDQAVAGVINIVTQANPKGQMSVWTREDGQPSGSIMVPVAISDQLSLLVGGEYDQYEGFRENSGRTNASGFGELTWRAASGQVRLRSEYTDSEVRFAGSLTKEEAEDDPRQTNTPDDFQRNKTWSHRVSGEWDASAELSVASEAYYRTNEYESFLFGGAGEIQRDAWGVSPRLIWSPLALSALEVTTGADVVRAELVFDSAFTQREITQWQYAGYLQSGVAVTSGLTLTAGGRYAATQEELVDATVYPEGESLSQQASALGLGAHWQQGELHVNLNWEQTFRFAKVDEQAFTETGVTGLKPQRGHTIEGGVAIRNSLRDVEIQGYRITLVDEIYYDPTLDGPWGAGTGANTNGDESVRTGMHAHWQEQWLSALWTRVSVDYVIAEFASGDNKGKRIPGVPSWQAGAQLGLRPLEALTLVTDVRYYGERYLGGDNSNSSDPLEAYALVDLSANYQVPRVNDLSIQARVNNVLDQQYSAAAFASNWGADSYYPGDGRNYFAGLTYRF